MTYYSLYYSYVVDLVPTSTSTRDNRKRVPVSLSLSGFENKDHRRLISRFGHPPLKSPVQMQPECIVPVLALARSK